MSGSQSPLVLQQLTKHYGKQRGVENLSLEVKPGEVFGFLGPNGAGKSTTIRTIMNFQSPTSGKALVFGLDSVKHSAALKARIGYLAGDFMMYENLTGAQYLKFMAHIRGINSNEVTPLANRLQATLNKKIKHLSRGNKQKIGLIAALLHDPDLLILDEPTSGLDPLMQQTFYDILKEHTAQGKSVFMSSHVLSEVQTTCDRVAFMKEGQLAEIVDVNHLAREGNREVRIIPTSGTKLMKLPSFKQLEVIKHTKEELVFITSEPSKSLLQWLGMQPVKDVMIQKVGLNELFLQLYSGATVETDAMKQRQVNV